MPRQHKEHYSSIFFVVFLTTSSVVFFKFSTDGEGTNKLSRAQRFIQPGDEGGENSTVRIMRQIIRLTNPPSHMGSSEMGIPVGEALDPPLCPPPPLTRSLGICYLKKCSSHQECSEGSACCFNGCIHSCIEPMDRPAAFDWIEDTSKVLPIFESDYEDSPVPFFPIPLQIQPSQFEAAVGEEELVHLPGGCFVTASRYKELKEFMKAPSIKECRCNEGEIVCDIRREKA